MKTKLPPTQTLGPVSAKLINTFSQQGKTNFTLREASEAYGKDNHTTAKFLSTLVKRNVLLKIKSGTYLIPQIGQENIQINNWPVIAHELVKPENYFISYYSAMRLHGMTTHPLTDVYITMPKKRSTKKIGHLTYHFIYSKPAHFWGGSIKWVTKQDQVFVTDVEKTLLDGLERPELCGGIKEIVRAIWMKQNEIDWEKMKKYTEKFHTKAVIKRLGFILEMLDLGKHLTPFLAKKMAHSRGYILLNPNEPKEGKYLNRWFIQLNMNIEELKASVWE